MLERSPNVIVQWNLNIITKCFYLVIPLVVNPLNESFKRETKQNFDFSLQLLKGTEGLKIIYLLLKFTFNNNF